LAVRRPLRSDGGGLGNISCSCPQPPPNLGWYLPPIRTAPQEDWHFRGRRPPIAKFTQVILVVEGDGGLPSALFGLDDEGRLFYGELEYSRPHPGPSRIRWRLVESDRR